MEFRWEPFIHDPTVRVAAKFVVFLPIALVAWKEWSARSLTATEVLLVGIAVFLAVAALGSKPVVRCDGCAYTTNAS